MARPAVLFQRRGRQDSDAGVVCAGGRAAARFSNRNQLKASSPRSAAQTISVSVLTHARSVRSRRACVAKHACCALAGCTQAGKKGIEIPHSGTICICVCICICKCICMCICVCISLSLSLSLYTYIYIYISIYISLSLSLPLSLSLSLSTWIYRYR